MPGLDTLAPPRPTSGNAPDVNNGGLNTQNAPDPHEETLRIVLASLDKSVDAFAREAAHEDLSARPEGRLWKRVARSVWQNLSHEYQTVSKTQEKRAEILESGNLLHHHQGQSDQAWREATVNRFSSDYADDLLRDEETIHHLSSAEHDGNESAQRIREDVLGLVADYAKGEFLDVESFEEAQQQMVEQWRAAGISQEFLGEGQLLAHNVTAIAEQVQAALDASQGLAGLQGDELLRARSEELDRILSGVEVVTGEAKVGSTVEIGETVSERLAAKLSRVPFVNESRLSGVVSFLGNETAVAAMMSVFVAGGQRTLSTAMAAATIPGLGGGIIAGVRERNALKRERALLARRLDAGERIDPNDKRQSELAETLYKARPVEELLGELKSAYDDDGEIAIRTHEDLDRVMQALSESKVRMERTAQGTRLISFENIHPEEMEERRFDMELTLAKLEVDMKRLFENPVARGVLDIRDAENFESWAAMNEALLTGQIEGEITSKDRLFTKLVGKRVLRRAFYGTLMGAGIGLSEHEAAALVGGVIEAVASGDEHAQAVGDLHMQPVAYETGTSGPHAPDTIGHASAPDTIGHVEAPDTIGHAPTAPDTIGHASSAPDTIGHNDITAPDVIGRNGGATAPDVIGHVEPPDTIGGGSAPETIGMPDGSETHVVTETTKINLPSGFKVQNDDGSLIIKGPNGEQFRGLALNKDGSLSSSALEQLKQAGFRVSPATDIIKGPPDIRHATVSGNEFVRNHAHDPNMVKTHVERWLVNGTPQSDLNELGIQNSVSGNGNIVIDVRGMAPGGSFDSKGHVDWREAARQGHLKVFISASRGSQSHSLQFVVPQNGRLEIPKDSPAAALFTSSGKFIGGFERVALDGGVDSKGVHQIASLATEVGSNKNSFSDTISTPTLVSSHTYTLTSSNPATTPTAATTSNSFVPPIIPLTGRQRLGRAPRQSGPTVTATVTGSGGPIPRQAAPSNGLPSAPNSSNAGPTTATPGLGGSPNTPPQAGQNPNAQNGPTPNNPNTPPTPNAAPNQPGQAPASGAEAPGLAGAGPNVIGPDSPNAGTTPPNPDQAAAEEEARRREAEQAQREREQAQREAAERLFAASLDAEELHTPAGYDFQGYSSFGSRERKLAMRFVAQAQREVGNDNEKAAIIARAQELANDAVGDTTGTIADMYREALTILQQSAERINAQAANNSGNQNRLDAMLRDLDAEARPYPYASSVSLNVASGMGAFGGQAVALATRVVLSAQSSIAQRPGESSDSYRKRVIRRAMSRIGSLQADNPDLYEQTARVLTASLPPNRQESRTSNPWDNSAS